MNQVQLVSMPPEIAVAFMCIAGKYGNGDERKAAVTALGLDYTKVQNCVNALVKLMGGL